MPPMIFNSYMKLLEAWLTVSVHTHVYQLIGMHSTQKDGPSPGKEVRPLSLKMVATEDEKEAVAGPSRQMAGAAGKRHVIHFVENKLPSGKMYGASFHLGWTGPPNQTTTEPQTSPWFFCNVFSKQCLNFKSTFTFQGSFPHNPLS